MKAVHIGFPKTGTKFLQAQVFPRLPQEITYLSASAPLFEELIHCDDTVLDVAALERRLAQACNGHENVLLSYEPLTGEPLAGFVNRTIIANRLRRLGFDKIIITIRNQFDLLESAYKQYVRSGGLLRFEEYVRFDGPSRHALNAAYFAYNPIYSLYAELFGRANVLVLQYENLGSSAFLGALSAFLEIGSIAGVDAAVPVNRSLSSTKTKTLRIINHLITPAHLISRRLSASFFYRQLVRFPGLNDTKSFLDARMRCVVADFYRESNDRLRKEAGITLASNYP
jgi:hypothetical protein